MADTKIADVIVPEVFNPYVVQRTSDLARFYMGGIVSNNPELDALASQGGKLVNMPFWDDLTGDDEVLADNAALTVNNISSGKDVAALHMRGKAWGVNDLAKALSGDDPMQAIGNLVADFWARKYRTLSIQSLIGVLADNVTTNSGDMISDISGATNADVTAATKFSAEALIDGLSTFGDSIGGVVGIAFHPDVYYAMQKLDLISFQKESEGDATVETYRGLRVVVDRTLPFTPAAGALAGDAAAQYTTLLFGAGALGLGQGDAPVPTETDRDSLAGSDILITRSHFLMHPRGVKFNAATVAGHTPSNAELALTANWTRVYERNNVRIASIQTNG